METSYNLGLQQRYELLLEDIITSPSARGTDHVNFSLADTTTPTSSVNYVNYIMRSIRVSSQTLVSLSNA